MRTHTRAHTHTHARTHARTHTHTQKEQQLVSDWWYLISGCVVDLSSERLGLALCGKQILGLKETQAEQLSIQLLSLLPQLLVLLPGARERESRVERESGRERERARNRDRRGDQK